jgi:hypothetical protein
MTSANANGEKLEPPTVATTGPPTDFGDGALFKLLQPMDLSDGRNLSIPTSPAWNTVGKSWGAAIALEFKEPPLQIAPVHMFDHAGGLWGVTAVNNGLLNIVGKRIGGGPDFTLHVPVDPLAGRKVHILLGWSADSRLFEAWIDRTLHRTSADGIGFASSYTPPLQFNNASRFGFNDGGRFIVHDLIYRNDRAPTQADAMAFSDEEVQAGFRVGADNFTVWAEAGGPEFARAGAHAHVWLDGQHVDLEQVRNNPLTILRWEAPLPPNAGFGFSPVRGELFWAPATRLEPNVITTAEVTLDRFPPPTTPASPRSLEGIPHIRRDGSIGAELRPDSDIYVGLYGFGPGQLTAATYGKTVRDELLAANIGLEVASILQFPPLLDANVTFEEYWQSTASFRQATEQAFAESDWTGPHSCPEDDFTRDIGNSLAQLMARPRPWLERVVMAWHAWRSWFRIPSGMAQEPRFILGKDECNLAFGADPAGSHVNLDQINPHGGIARLSAAFRATGRPFSWPVAGIGEADQHNVVLWHRPEYSDFVTQYDASGNLRAPWTGTTLRQRHEILGWAAKQRDPSRPFSLNVSLTLANMETDQPGGEWFKARASSSPRLIPAQLWVALAYGASVLRAYSMARFDHVLPPRGRPDGNDWFEVQVRPGTPEYHAFIKSARLVRNHARLILGAEQPLRDAGPDFICGHRAGPEGRIFWAVNLSESPRSMPPPPFAATRWMIMDSNGDLNPGDHPHPMASVPGNGVAIVVRDGRR